MRQRLIRSPSYVLTLVVGVVVLVLGWAAATLFGRTISALTRDVSDVWDRLPVWLSSAGAIVASGGVVAGLALVQIWLISERRFRRLALANTALVAGAALSIGLGALVEDVLEPMSQARFDAWPSDVARTTLTSPAMAGLVAVLVMVRQWLPVRSRLVVYLLTAFLLLVNLADDGSPPYLGILLDVGAGMVAGSVVALLLRTPDLQPDGPALVRALAHSGLEVTELRRADVDARGSEPWLGTTVDGRPLFVKALSADQRAADLLFRAMRWARLRRTGDGPPELALKRAAEHEALVSHHARSLGVATPPVLAVVSVGTGQVALAYEGMRGRSLDKVAVDELTDRVVVDIWRQVALLHRHGVAHRDLRLANVFLTDDDAVLLIDFGFAELSASQQLLDTDVAELLAATSCVIGVERAVRLAGHSLGIEQLERAHDWLHPLALSSATRHAVAACGGLDTLRAEVDSLTGHTVSDYVPLGRLSAAHVIGVLLGALGVYSLLALVVHHELMSRAAAVKWPALLVACAVGLLAPLLTAATYRAAADRRVTFRSVRPAAFAAQAPVAAPTGWSFANRVLSDAARETGLQAVTAKTAAADRCVASLATAPLLIASFAAAGLRFNGQLRGALLGLAAGVAAMSIEALMIVSTPFGRELWRVWLQPFRSRGALTSARAAVAAWAAATLTAQGLAFALAARSAGVDSSVELLIALGVAGIVIAWLVPAPGGLGAFVLLTGLGLSVGSPLTVALIGAAFGQVALFWVALPLGLWHFRTAHRQQTAAAEIDGSVEVDLGLGSLPGASPTHNWWT